MLSNMSCRWQVPLHASSSSTKHGSSSVLPCAAVVEGPATRLAAAASATKVLVSELRGVTVKLLLSSAASCGEGAPDS